jgi:hypothetical protein
MNSSFIFGRNDWWNRETWSNVLFVVKDRASEFQHRRCGWWKKSCSRQIIQFGFSPIHYAKKYLRFIFIWEVQRERDCETKALCGMASLSRFLHSIFIAIMTWYRLSDWVEWSKLLCHTNWLCVVWKGNFYFLTKSDKWKRLSTQQICKYHVDLYEEKREWRSKWTQKYFPLSIHGRTLRVKGKMAIRFTHIFSFSIHFIHSIHSPSAVPINFLFILLLTIARLNGDIFGIMK